MKLFTVCQPRLESVLRKELLDLGLIDHSIAVHPGSGGIAFEGDLTSVYAANLQLRTASRVLVRLGSFHATGFSEFKKKIARLDWSPFLRKGTAIDLRVSSKKSKLYHTGAIGQRIREALELKSDIRPSFGAITESQTIIVRVMRDEFTFSMDSSGAHLHKRGYRPTGAKAPLRETLAAAMLYHSGWDQKSTLIDPFCGAGTIPIEAVLMASSVAPGLHREFAFENWPHFNQETFGKIKVKAKRRPGLPPSVSEICGYDRDQGAIDVARENAARAGAADGIQFNAQALSDVKRTADKGWLVTNPPYGHRISGKQDLRNLYARFGQILKSDFTDWHCCIVCSDEKLIRQMGIPLISSPFLENGGIKVKLYSGRVK